MTTLLIVDDSPTARSLLRAVFDADPQLRVVGEARDGREAVRMARELAPDIITMDVLMPEMDGLDAVKEIMISAPTRIVIVSAHQEVHEVAGSLQALRLGALAVLPKPPPPGAPDFQAASADLLKTLRSMAEIKVVRRWRDRPAGTPPPPPTRPMPAPCRLVAIASSTGGPAALRFILAALPPTFSLPILIVQHMPTGFTRGLASWLNDASRLTVKLAEPGERLAPAHVYLAPENRHLGIAPATGRILLSDTPPIGGFRPSATFLFDSVAQTYGRSALGLILTGMGRDGVDGLQALHAATGWVIAQDEATSVVYGMPGQAVAAGVADQVLPLEAIPLALMEAQQREHAAV